MYVAESSRVQACQYELCSWKQVTNMILTNEMEVGLGTFFIMSKYLSTIGYLPPILEMRLTVYIKDPEGDDPAWNYILSAFSPEIWISVAATMTVVSLVLTATWYLTDRPRRHRKAERYILCNSCFNIFRIFCQQGQTTTPGSLSGRCVVITSYVTALVLLASYSAVFVSFLTVRRSSLPFTDFQGLLSDGTYRLGGLDNSGDLRYLDESPDPVIRAVYKKLVRPYEKNLPSTDREGMRRVCDEDKYAYLSERLHMRMISSGIPCSFVPIPQAFFPTSGTMIVRKKSPFKRMLSRQVQNMRRSGILKRIQATSLPDAVRKEPGTSPRSVELKTLVPTFMVFMSGVLLSLFCLLLEFVTYNAMKIK